MQRERECVFASVRVCESVGGCLCVWLYMGAHVGWRAGEAWARGEDESAIEHHQIKRYLMPALTRPARKQVHSLSTENTAVLLPAKTLLADAVSWVCTSEKRHGFQLHLEKPSGYLMLL